MTYLTIMRFFGQWLYALDKTEFNPLGCSRKVWVWRKPPPPNPPPPPPRISQSEAKSSTSEIPPKCKYPFSYKHWRHCRHTDRRKVRKYPGKTANFQLVFAHNTMTSRGFGIMSSQSNLRAAWRAICTRQVETCIRLLRGDRWPGYKRTHQHDVIELHQKRAFHYEYLSYKK